MKPFDLQKALAGYPVITRDGRRVTQLTLFDIANHYLYPLVGVIEGTWDIQRWTKEGKFEEKLGVDRQVDLFMSTVKKKGWVIIRDGELVSNSIYKSVACASTFASGHDSIVPVEWDE